MKSSTIIAIIALSLCIDYFLQFSIPGFSFLTPAVLIVLMILSKNISRDMVILVLGMIAYDMFSGFYFGFFTLAYILTVGTLLAITHWIDLRRISFPSLVIPTILFSIEFVSIIFIFYGLT